jgi:hypothetical protein
MLGLLKKIGLNDCDYRGSQTAVDLPAPRTLGVTEEGGAVYVASSSNGITEVIFVRAIDQRFMVMDNDKENMMGRYVHCLLCACVQFLYSSLHRFG